MITFHIEVPSARESIAAVRYGLLVMCVVFPDQVLYELLPLVI
jgi:hypothetical protein